MHNQTMFKSVSGKLIRCVISSEFKKDFEILGFSDSGEKAVKNKSTLKKKKA